MALIPQAFQQIKRFGNFVVREVGETFNKIDESETFKKTEKFFQETARFGVRTAVGFSDIVTEGVDFATDFVATNARKVVGEGLTAPFLSKEKSEKLANDWRTFYRNNPPITQIAKEGVDRIERTKFIQPSQDWVKAPLQEKLTIRFGETVLNIGPSIVSSIAESD